MHSMETQARAYKASDFADFERIHTDSGLPEACLPPLTTQAFPVKQVVEYDGKPAIGVFVRQVGEVFLVIDHSAGTPEWRWEALQAVATSAADEAYYRGFSDITIWVPDEVAKSFDKRLRQLGFNPTPDGWKTYTRVLT